MNEKDDLYRKIMGRVRHGCCASRRRPCAVHSSYAAGVEATLAEIMPPLEAARELIRSLLETMHTQGDHHCSNLSVEQWQVIAQAEGQM